MDVTVHIICACRLALLLSNCNQAGGERDDFGNETVFEKDTYTPLFLEKPMINVCPWN